MKNSFRFFILSMSLLLCLSAAAFGQKTTGDVEGTVTDQKGAVVPGVSVTLKGVTVGYNRTVQSDSEGRFRFSEVPVGGFKISTAATSGFSESSIENVTVTLERTTTADITLNVAGSVNTVDVSSDPLGVNVDPTDSKVQTSITSKLADQLPKGTGFASLLKVSPATRAEPISGQFQIDGASGSENTFIVDGQPVENYRTGILNQRNNIPVALVSEVQVKSSGFEAEFGGASGGVISVVTKSGSDTIRGEFGMMFDIARLNPTPRSTVSRFVSTSTCPSSGTPPPTQATCNAVFANNPDYSYLILQPKDKYTNFFPTGTLSGPVIKRHLWFLGSYSPQIYETRRPTSFYNAINNSQFSTGQLVLVPRAGFPPIEYRSTTKYNYAFGRLDAAILSNLRGTVTYLWNPIEQEGVLPYAAITTSTPVVTTLGGIAYPSGPYNALRGGYQPSNNFTSQLVYTPNNKLILNGRYGHSYTNEKLGNYAIPSETLYSCGGSETAYTQYSTGCPTGRGFQNVSTNSNTLRDATWRNELNLDAGYLLGHFGGRHEFKGGFQYGTIKNDVANGYAETGQVTLYYGQDYSQANTGVSLTCALGSASCIGVGTLTRIGTRGIAENSYKALYIQDKWQPTKKLTLNLGVRAEKENIPSYTVDGKTSSSDVVLPWSRKIAPRLGVAYDLFGDGKTRIFGSYGLFFDRLKFDLARGLFGGDFYRQDYFPITAANPTYSYYTPARILGSFTDPIGGGNPSTTGGLSQLQRDFRIPSNLTDAQKTALGIPLAFSGGIDPNIKPFAQSEITVGVERQMFTNYVLRARFTRKNVESTIEDHAIVLENEAENYYIGNPGEGLDFAIDRQAGYLKSAKPQRLYKGLEITLDRRLANNYFFNLNYTLSSLYGNYSGLASSDELRTTASTDGIGSGRASPNGNRFFDYAINGYTLTGEPDNGYLATDRRHAFKAYGGYNFDWFGSKVNSTEFSFFQQILSGTPVTTFITVMATAIPETKRGDLGRTPYFYQTDLSLSHRYRFGRDNRFTMVFDFNVLNVFNNNSPTSLVADRQKYRTTNAITFSDICPTCPDESPASIAKAFNTILSGGGVALLQQLRNGTLPSLSVINDKGVDTGIDKPNPIASTFGQPNRYQDPRNVRFGFRLIF